jgi:hypothetical protein
MSARLPAVLIVAVVLAAPLLVDVGCGGSKPALVEISLHLDAA